MLSSKHLYGLSYKTVHVLRVVALLVILRPAVVHGQAGGLRG